MAFCRRCRSIRLLGVVFALVACMCVLSGCLESPVLVNYVLDPSSDNIDYDNPLKHYVPDPQAQLTSQDVAAVTDMTVEEVEKVLHDDPIYDDDQQETTDKPAESATYAPAQTSQTTTARQVDSPDAKKNKSNDKVDSKERGGAGANAESPDRGESGGGKPDDVEGVEGGESDDSQGDGAQGDDSEAEGPEAALQDDPDSNDDAKAVEPGLVYNGRGKLEKLPTDLKSVCAVGDAAAMVISIAGADCLAGADEAFLTDSNVSKVFGASVLERVSACWDGDASEAEDIRTDAIVASGPSAVLMVSGSEEVDKAAQDELRGAGISVVVLPQLSSDTYIRNAVRVVGQLFSETTEGASVKKADEYTARVQQVLDAAKATHGGSVSSFNSVDYDNVTDPTPTRGDAGSPTSWTVLLTGWDENASVSARFDGRTIFDDKGVALSRIGWRWSPVSYYLGCGGAVNNAAAYAAYSSDGLRMFLSYNENQISYDWSGLDSEVELGKDGGSFKQGGSCVLANACDAQGLDKGHYLGSPDFNKVVAANADIAERLVKARKSPLGLYTPGSYETTSSMSGYGVVLDDKLLLNYSVAADESRGDVLYDVLVNPCGMVGTWVEGSMESFLEAAWAASVFSGYDESSLRDDVSGFYRDFYGYELSGSELDDILKGVYAG